MMALVATVGAAILASDPRVAADSLPAGNPLAVEATARVPLDVESALSIVGIHGQITVAPIAERELRVISRTTSEPGVDLPVGIWTAGSRLILAPAPGDAGAARRLHVEVPQGLAVSVDASDSAVSVGTDGGGIDLQGKNLRSDLQARGASITVDQTGGSLKVRSSQDATLRVRDVDTVVNGLSGSVTVHAVGNRVSVSKIEGASDIDTDGVKLVLERLSGPLRLKAQRGDAQIAGAESGADLALAGTPLHLRNGKGEVVVTSDAPIEFQGMAATMRIDTYGTPLNGMGNDGSLEVHARSCEVSIASIKRGLKLQGDDLKARLSDVGELRVDATRSDVDVSGAGSVVLKTDGGNVTIQRPGGGVSATVTGGDARILDAGADVTLDLSAGNGEVSFASIVPGKDSNLVNRTDDLTVRFPSRAVCRVEAKSTVGSVESDLPTVKVLGGLTEAQGPINSGYTPIIHVVANGNIRLLQTASGSP
jgi:hypothetical protein